MPAKRVLIVDDAMDFGRMVQASLITLDPALKITLVPSAEEALLETSRVSPDLLVADMRLPGMSGLDLLRKVRARYPSVRVIVVTGVKDPGLEEKFLQAGADRFFVKPLAMNDFLPAATDLLAAQPQTARQRSGMTGTLTSPAPAARPGSTGSTGRLRVRVTPERAAELIAGLRQTLSARVVILADAHGQILTRAGEQDAAFDADVIPAALATLNSSRKLGHMAGDSAQSVLAFKGKESEIVIAPVGDLALIIGMRPARGQLRLALAFEEALAFQKECGGVILPASAAPVRSAAAPVPSQPVRSAAAPVPSQPVRSAAAPVPSQPVRSAAAPVPSQPVRSAAAPPPPSEDDNTPADLGDLEKLFQQPLSKARVDVNTFWENALDSTGDRVASPDVISYEQARQMGLNPDNNGHL